MLPPWISGLSSAGGVVKTSASMAVVKKNQLFHNAEELYEYCTVKLSKIGPASTYSSQQCLKL